MIDQYHGQHFCPAYHKLTIIATNTGQRLWGVNDSGTENKTSQKPWQQPETAPGGTAHLPGEIV